MPMTNTEAQTIITKQMDTVSKDKDLTVQEKSKLLARLNDSMVRNSHVQLRAMRLTSTVNRRKQTSLPAPNTLLKMPVLKV